MEMKKKQRIIFVNPHGNVMLVRTLGNIVFKQSSARKHRYLLDELLSRPEIEVCFYVNPNGFSIGHSFSRVVRSFLRLFRFMEYNYVMKKNGLDVKKITALRNAKEIRKDDIVLLYIKYPLQFDDMEKIEAFKVVSLIHLSPNYAQTSTLMERIHPQLICGESNYFTFNPKFKCECEWFDGGHFMLSPFVFEERFVSKTLFRNRKNKAISVGTITQYKGEIIQPWRKQIKENTEVLNDCIECYNEYYQEDRKVEEALLSDTFVIRMKKKLYYALHSGHQTKYFSFDMVEKFNEYKMCIVGEEITGVPGIGFVEGMACGCAYIGLNNGLYEQYGLKEGVHYIGYDGTLSDLTGKIKYWQRPENQNKLEEIARTGCAYVREHFNKEAVASLLLTRLLDAHKVWRKEYLPESY